jgi:hypothetical protein
LALCAPLLAGACARPAPPSDDRQAEGADAGRASVEEGSPSGSLRVEFIEVLRHSRDVVEVRLALFNAGDQPLDVGTRFAQREQDGPSVSGMALVEEAVQKRSFVLRDAGDQPACSRGLTPLAPGERRVVWARFPAPVSPSVTVLLPGAEPLTGVDVPANDPR